MPGSGKQSDQVQQQIIEFLEAGIDPTTIHRRLKVGRSSIYRMKRCLQQHGTAYAPPETNKKNGRPKVMTAEQEGEIRTWLQDPSNRDRYLDDMVWFIHERFGMVCSTTTCSKIKRKWLKVIEAEERGEMLDPAEAQEQVLREAFRVGKKQAVVMPGSDGDGQGAVVDRHMQSRMQMQSGVESSTSMSMPLELSSSPMQVDTHLPVALEMVMQQQRQQQQQQQPLPRYTPQIDQSLSREYKPQIDRQLQEQLETEVAHAALRQHQGSV